MMNIKSKLALYFSILIFIVFSISSIITGAAIRFTFNRLLYNNVVILNDSVIQYLNHSSHEDYQALVDNIKDITSVEIVLMDENTLVASTFDSDIPNLDLGIIVSENYQVWRLRLDNKAYYYTVGTLDELGYDIYVLRSENLTVTIPQNLYFTSLLGIMFFVIAISSVIFYASQSFVNPIRVLRDYANTISPELPKKDIQSFSIKEFSELGESLESTWERLNQYRDYQKEFLHNFSHEMKTPLTNIYGYAEGIMYGVLNEEEKKKGLEIIIRESERIKSNIDQILLIGKLESDESGLISKKINLVNIIGDALNSVQIEATNANIQLIFTDYTEKIIKGDADRLEIAFINVISNGIRYAKSKIQISIDEVDKYYQISIADDGLGIPDNVKNRVFDRFFIGDKGLTGLGLTISKTIIEKHKGLIIVTDSREKGANFIIKLPKLD